MRETGAGLEGSTDPNGGHAHGRPADCQPSTESRRASTSAAVSAFIGSIPLDKLSRMRWDRSACHDNDDASALGR